MIEEIKINGTLYKLQSTIYSNMDYCTLCDLISFCQKEEKFINLCKNTNNNGYYIKDNNYVS